MIAPGEVITPKQRDEAIQMYWDDGYAFQIQVRLGAATKMFPSPDTDDSWHTSGSCGFDSFETCNYRRHPSGAKGNHLQQAYLDGEIPVIDDENAPELVALRVPLRLEYVG